MQNIALCGRCNNRKRTCHCNIPYEQKQPPEPADAHRDCVFKQ